MSTYPHIQIYNFFECKIVIFFLPISLNICFGAQKNGLIETVLLSTHNICFGQKINKINFKLYTLIWRPVIIRNQQCPYDTEQFCTMATHISSVPIQPTWQPTSVLYHGNPHQFCTHTTHMATYISSVPWQPTSVLYHYNPHGNLHQFCTIATHINS